MTSVVKATRQRVVEHQFDPQGEGEFSCISVPRARFGCLIHQTCSYFSLLGRRASRWPYFLDLRRHPHPKSGTNSRAQDRLNPGAICPVVPLLQADFGPDSDTPSAVPLLLPTLATSPHVGLFQMASAARIPF